MSLRAALIQSGSMARFKLDSSAPSASAIYENVRREMSAHFESIFSKPNPPQLVILPEMFAQPYSTEYFPYFARELPKVGSRGPFNFPLVDFLAESARKYNAWIVGGSLSEKATRPDGKEGVYNTTLVFDSEGTVRARHRKIHLFDISVPGGITFRESDTLSPGDSVTVFDSPWGRMGIAICYDIRFPELSMTMRERGARIFIVPGAFNSTTGPAHWEVLLRARAVDNQSFVLACSPARHPEKMGPDGKENYPAHGHSMVVNPWGQVSSILDHHNQGHIIVDLDLNHIDRIREQIPLSKQKRPDLYRLVDVKGGSGQAAGVQPSCLQND